MPRTRLQNAHLKVIGRIYHLNKRVPNDIREIDSRQPPFIQKTLRTRDVNLARALRDQQIKELEAEWHLIRQVARLGRASENTAAVGIVSDNLLDQAIAVAQRSENPRRDGDEWLEQSGIWEELDELEGKLLAGRDFQSLDELSEIRTKLLDAHPRGRFLGTVIQAARREATPIKPIAIRWLEDRRDLKPATLQEYTAAIDKLTDTFYSFEEITKSRASEFIRDQLQGRALATVQKRLNAYRGLYEYAGMEDQGRVLWRSPGRQIRGIAKPAIERQAWSDDELQKLIDASSTERDTRLRDAILIAAYTGARAQGIANIDARVGSDGKKVLWIPETKTKNSARLIPCHHSIESIVERWQAAQKEDFMSPKAITKRFTRLKGDLGYPNDRVKVLHSFRHSFMTKLEVAGVDPLRVKRLAGHSLGGDVTFGLYAKGPSAEDMRTDIEKLHWAVNF